MKIYCEKCKNEIKLPFWFWSHTIRCKKCKYKVDFRNNEKLILVSVILRLLLLAVCLFVRPIIEKELEVSYILSVLITLLIALIVVIVFISPVWRMIISKSHKIN